MSGTESPRIGRRLEFAVYGAATFSNSLGYMIMVVLPLWVLTLDAGPLMIGIILGARHFLVLIYSIHGGAMMDRLDVRRMMVSFGSIGVVLPLLYPLTSSAWVVIVLQMAAGYCSAIGWMGAQAIIGQAMKGSAVHTGRMSATLRIGSLIGPPIAGAAWDLGGPWGAFASLSFWGLCLLLCCLALPAHETADAARPQPRLRDLVPRLEGYVATLRLLTIPLVMLVMLVSVVRIAGFGMQASFYTVYLEGQGYTGTMIGLLLAIYSLFGGGLSLMTGRLTRLFRPMWLMIAVIAGSIAAIAITPALGSFALLALAAGINGGCYGLSQPLMISNMSRVVSPGDQGKAVGLRTTANRLAASFMPVVMGAVVEAAGLGASFYITGGALLLMLLAVAVWGRNIANSLPTTSHP